MPTQKNVKRPFTLIGNGRSGTSLVSKLFNAHPDCFFAGETVNLIHGVWRSLECSLPANRHGDIPETLRKQFLHLFPSKKRYWMQKPIGIPIIAGTFPEEEQFYEWYWSVVTETFPEARFFTVLRHPLDVLISSDQWWDYGMPAIVESNRKIAKLLTHPDSPVEIAVNYHELIQSPQLEVTRLFSLMEMPEHERCMTVFDHGHVLNPETSDDEDKAKFKYSIAFFKWGLSITKVLLHKGLGKTLIAISDKIVSVPKDPDKILLKS